MNLPVYAAKVIVCSCLLFGYYCLVLRNKPFHRYNRLYLLAALALSVFLPLLRLPVLATTANASPVWSSLRSISVANWEEAVVITGRSHAFRSWWNLQALVLSAYITGCLIAAVPMFRTLLYIHQLRKLYSRTAMKGLQFYSTIEPGTPFSFGNMLFWNATIEPESPAGRQMLQHETVHIRSLHTVDILFSELLAIFFWFNPFFRLMRKELAALHEFLADAGATASTDPFEYAELLVSSAQRPPAVSMTNQFFQQQIKRRIAMIINNKPTRYSFPRKFMIVPLLVLVCCSFALRPKPSSTPPVLLQKPISAGNDTLAGKEFLERMVRVMTTKKEVSISMDEKRDWIVLRSKGGDPLVTHYSEFMKLAEAEKRKSAKSLPVHKSLKQVDEESNFPGGPQSWMRYLIQNFQYPAQAQAQGIQGTVIIQFNVDKFGGVSNVEVLEGPELGGLREEGVRIIQNSGTWIPASKNGKPVPSVKIQPIIFRLDPA